MVAAGGVAPSASKAQDTYWGLMHAVGEGEAPRDGDTQILWISDISQYKTDISQSLDTYRHMCPPLHLAGRGVYLHTPFPVGYAV